MGRPPPTDFPARCITDATVFDEQKLAEIPKAYVRHTSPPLASLERFYESSKAAGWKTAELACCHDTMLADPAGTAEVLAQLSV